MFLAAATGSWAIPHNDAWAYALIARHYAEQGSIELAGWNRSALIGQIVVLGHLGSSLIVQKVFVAVLAALGLLATYGLLEPRVGGNRALLGTALVGLMPAFGLLATSYMADVPAFTAVIGGLFLTDQALRTESTRWLLGALAVATWGVTVREQALVGLVVIVIITVTSWHGRKRQIALLGGLMSILAITGFELWRRSLPHDSGAPLASTGISLALALPIAICTCLTVALFVFPAVLVTARPRSWSRRTQLTSVSTLVLTVLIVIAAVLFRMGSHIFLPCYLAPGGAYSASSIGTRTALPGWWWFALVAMACMSLALIVGHYIDAGAPLDRMSGLVLILIAAGTLGEIVLGQAPYARFFLVLIPFACVALLGTREANNRLMPRWYNWLLSLTALAALAATTTLITANALAFDAARWKAASSLVARGVAPTDIDAGIEWVGYHASEPASLSSAHTQALGWYMRMFEHSRECYVVSASPLQGMTSIATTQYRTYALAGSSKLWTYRVSPCR
ncbi:MAG: glycosyltransferase family 39 protein [Actinomycetota bacterium]|nr:glycosyltransferase family 39 protein [Actinomycetota bacterium]